MTGFDRFNQAGTGDLAHTVPSGQSGGGHNTVPHVLGAGVETDHSAYDPQPDGRRYAACGDGVVASVAEWIATRLAAVIAAEADERQEAA